MLVQKELKNAYIGQYPNIQRYSYNFIDAGSVAQMQSDGWDFAGNTDYTITANGIHRNTSGFSGFANECIDCSRAKKITITVEMYTNAGSWTGGSSYGIQDGGYGQGTIGAGSSLQSMTYSGYNGYALNLPSGQTWNRTSLTTGNHTGTVILDLENKTAVAKVSGYTDINGTLTDAEVTDLKTCTWLCISFDNSGCYYQSIDIEIEEEEGGGGGGWQPGVNTIAYYPLEINGNEASGKSGLDITTTGITFSNNVAVLDGNQRPTVNSIAGYKTICFWFKKTNDYNGMILSQGDTDGYIQLRTNGFAAAGTGGGSFNNDYTAGGSTPSYVWRLCVITQTVASNSGASTGSMKFYLSDFGGVSGVRQYDTTNHYFNWGITSIGWSGNTSYHYALIGEMSKLILESTERTEQEISDYYNLTKGNYGL